MRRGWSALIVILLGASFARADYLFMQYLMGVKRNDPNAPATPGGAPGHTPPGSPPPPAPGTAPSGPAGTPNSDTVILAVNSVVEINKKDQIANPVSGRVKFLVRHKYGSTSLYNDDSLIIRLIPAKTVKGRFLDLKEGATRANSPPDKIYQLAEWALNHGLVEDFATVLDEVAKTGKKTGADHLDRAVDAYTQVKDALAKRFDREDASNAWRGKLSFRMSQSDHYSLLYNAALSDPPEVKRRLDMLERNMKAVYFWFALKGVVLPMPDQKLVAVLLDQPDQFAIQRELIEGEPLVADSFFNARDNVVVFSAQRLDVPSILFSRQMQAYYQQGWDKNALLSGKGASRLAGKSVDEQYKLATLALLDKSLEEEGERAAVTHDGTRQILVAAGLQKQNVVMPDWMQFGMASVFETPKGPYLTAPVEVRAPYWQTYGAPSWMYTRLFKKFENEYAKADETGMPIRGEREFTHAGRLLLSVVTDSDFNQVRDIGSHAGELKLIQARTHAWALSYFLLKDRPAGVIKLYQEFSSMPRDLDMEPKHILACFCRAFDVADDTRTKMDPAKFEELGKKWLGFMATVAPPGLEIKVGVEAPPPGSTGGPGGGSHGPGGGSHGPGGGPPGGPPGGTPGGRP